MTAVAYSRAGASQATTISEDVLDAAIRSGALKAKYLGRRVLIRPEDLAEYVAGLPDEPDKKASA